MQRFADFLRERIARDTYAEPPSEGHSQITAQVLPGVVELVKERFRDSFVPKVLDVGCGQGVALELFKEYGCTAWGTSLNDQDLIALKMKGFNAFYRLQEDLDGEWTGLFDLVWARHVLEHSVAPYWALCEFWRVLKPGGWLYVEVPGPDTACNHESNQNHYAVMGARMWEFLLQKAGFEFSERNEIKLMTPAGPDVYFGWVARKATK